MELLQSRIPETPQHPWFLGGGKKKKKAACFFLVSQHTHRWVLSQETASSPLGHFQFYFLCIILCISPYYKPLSSSHTPTLDITISLHCFVQAVFSPARPSFSLILSSYVSESRANGNILGQQRENKIHTVDKLCCQLQGTNKSVQSREYISVRHYFLLLNNLGMGFYIP